MPDGLSYTRAKTFRHQMTPPEARLWRFVRAWRLRGLKFRRQHPVGPYILDFYCAAARLAVEVDGQGHNDPDQMRHDARRTVWLGLRGIAVYRVAARTVLCDHSG